MRKLDLLRFMPFRMNRLTAAISTALATEYRDRYGIEIPEWRVIATLGFLDEPCTAQHVVENTSTHKSTISRAVTSLLDRHLIERIESADDRRAFSLRLTARGRSLYEKLIPRLLLKERDILSCLSPQEFESFGLALDKIEKSLDLFQATRSSAKMASDD